MYVKFNNKPAIVNEDGEPIRSVIDWTEWLKDSRDLTNGTIVAYVNGLSIFYDYLTYYGHLIDEDDEKSLEKEIRNFKNSLHDGNKELGWDSHSASYVNNVLGAISLYLDFTEMPNVICKDAKLNYIVKMRNKAQKFLGFIKTGRLASTSIGGPKQRNIRVADHGESDKVVKYFPPQKFGEFIDLVPSHRDKALYLLMAGTSARIGQSLNVWQKDILFDERKVNFVDPRTAEREEELFSIYNLTPDDRVCNKSSLGGHWIPPLRAAFFREATLYRLHGFIPESKQPIPHPYFFGTETGSRLMPRQVQAQFTAIATKLGLGDLTPHSLRHMYGFYLYNILNMDLPTIMKCMGHKSLSSTEIYTFIPDGVIEKTFKDAFKRLEDFNESGNNINLLPE